MKIMETEIFSVLESNTTFYEILDADWHVDFGTVILLKEEGKAEVLFNNNRGFTLPEYVSTEFPLVRMFAEDKILLANPRNEKGEDNIFLMGIDGQLLSSFNAGDGIMDMIIVEEGIWISYADEGIFGEGISREGLVLFSFNGEPLFKYHSGLFKKPFLTSCDAICEGKDSTIWIFPIMMPDVAAAFLHLDSKLNSLCSYPAPELLVESTALSVKGKDAFFASQFDPENNLYHWQIGKGNLQVIGQVQGIVRGLKVNDPFDFIAVTKNKVKLLQIIKA